MGNVNSCNATGKSLPIIENKIESDIIDIIVHLEATAKTICCNDEEFEKVEAPELSELELMDNAIARGFENDEQTRLFKKFLALCTNFSSLKAAKPQKTIPVLFKTIKELIAKVKEEIKEFADVAVNFSDLIHTFVKLIMNSKHTTRMARCHLEDVKRHMYVLRDAILPENGKPLSDQDQLDVDLALENMAEGIQKLLDHAKSSKQESDVLSNKIESFKKDIGSKATIVQGRINAANLTTTLGATIGMFRLIIFDFKIELNLISFIINRRSNWSGGGRDCSWY
jgi:hypothetical protein